jgi:hypothetical protein
MKRYVIQDTFWQTLGMMCGWEMQEATLTPRNMSVSPPRIPNTGISGNEINEIFFQLREPNVYGDHFVSEILLCEL